MQAELQKIRYEIVKDRILNNKNVEYKLLKEDNICMISLEPISHGNAYCECETYRNVMELSQILVLFAYDSEFEPKCPMCRNEFVDVPKIYFNKSDCLPQPIGMMAKLCLNRYDFRPRHMGAPLFDEIVAQPPFDEMGAQHPFNETFHLLFVLRSRLLFLDLHWLIFL